MNDTKIKELKCDMEELKELLSSAKRQRCKELLSTELEKLSAQVSLLIEQNNSQPSASTSNAAAASINKTQAQKCYQVKLTNYAWDQSDKFVKLFVTLKNVQSLEPDNIFCKFTDKSVEVNVKELENRNYVLTVNNLLNAIDETKSYWKVKTDMVVVFMAKRVERDNWSHLVSTDVKPKEPKLPNLEPDKDPYSELMKLMKKIYDDGDSDMKRTIAKAWTESRENNIHDF